MRHKSSGGIGLLGILQIIFIVLKLTNLIAWSWWAVLIPTWIGLGCFIIGLVIGIIAAIVAFDDSDYPW